VLGKNPFPQELTQTPFNLKVGEIHDGEVVVEAVTHPPNPLSTNPVGQPPKMQAPF
jgi:hypothetical protein